MNKRSVESTKNSTFRSNVAVGRVQEKKDPNISEAQNREAQLKIEKEKNTKMFSKATQEGFSGSYKVLPYKEDFLLELENNNYSKETVYNYDRDLSVFEGFLTIAEIDFEKINKQTIIQYKGFLQSGRYLMELEKIGWERLFIHGAGFLLKTSVRKGDSGVGQKSTQNSSKKGESRLAPRSINRMLSALRSYLKFLIDFDLKPQPLAPDAVKLIKMERKKSQVAELKDLISLIESPTLFERDKKVAIRNRAILELLFSTGMRISELVSLNREQLNLSGENVNEQGKVYVMGKGKKQRFVYLTPRCQFYVQEYLKSRDDDYPALFIPYRGGRNGRRGQRLSTNYIQAKIAEYRRKLGIVVPTSAHSLRHGFATYMAERGASPAAIQILLGHESLNTTDKYLHASDKFASETHKKYHPLPQLPSKTVEK